MNLLKTTMCFGGEQRKYEHESSSTNTSMQFSVFVPSAASPSAPAPVFIWLSGLTCTDENFITKAGAQRVAENLGIAIVCPDTSPRGANVPGEVDSWDFGTGAGFYVDAVADPWAKNYNMYSYVVQELPKLLAANIPELDITRMSISGHSMGGHGALVCFLRNPELFKSVSAFAPICHPSACPWGVKAFTGYLGPDQSTWAEYDATALAQLYRGPKSKVLIDQGLADQFYLDRQLLPEDLKEAAGASDLDIELRMHERYDHSYYFVATFIEEHLRHAAAALWLK